MRFWAFIVGVLRWVGHHLLPRVRFGANTLSTIAALVLTVWVYYYFWIVGRPDHVIHVWLGVFTPARLGMDLAWVGVVYLVIQYLTASLTTFSKDRWLGAVIDVLSSFVPLIAVIIAMYDSGNLIKTPVRWEAATFVVFLTLSEIAGSILLTLITNSRWIGFSGAGQSPAASAGVEHSGIEHSASA